MSFITNEFAPLGSVKIRDGFWSRYQDIAKEKIIPYQWRVLNDQVPDTEPSHAIANFRIAAGLEKGDFHGYVFQDSDVAKWLEAVAYRLTIAPDAALEQTADGVIDLIGQAQEEDGYLVQKKVKGDMYHQSPRLPRALLRRAHDRGRRGIL